MKEGDLVRHLMDDQTGVVVLAWGVKRMNDGQNVLAHEDNMEVVSEAR
jgi:hypothetical protein